MARANETTITMELPERAHWRPMVLSLITHAVLMACLLWLISNAARSDSRTQLRTGQIVLASADQTSHVKFLEESNTVVDTSVPAGLAEISESSPPAIPDSNIQPIELPGASAADSPLDPAEMAASDTNSAAIKPYELTTEDLKMIEADRKSIESQRPAGPATSIRVFGSGNLTGRKFVFLIDRSRSMGDQGLGVLKKARTELVAAIDELENHHEFQIVAYHDRTATIARRELLPATDENKRLVPDYMANLVAYGGTNHQNGIYAALAFNPDVIVMLSDGGLPELHEGHLDAIRKSVGGRTQIHTFQFGSGPLQREGDFLKQLAEQNSGTWRYINVRQWAAGPVVERFNESPNTP